jgi:hypothetical protein
MTTTARLLDASSRPRYTPLGEGSEDDPHMVSYPMPARPICGCMCETLHKAMHENAGLSEWYEDLSVERPKILATLLPNFPHVRLVPLKSITSSAVSECFRERVGVTVTFMLVKRSLC